MAAGDGDAVSAELCVVTMITMGLWRAGRVITITHPSRTPNGSTGADVALVAP